MVLSQSEINKIDRRIGYFDLLVATLALTVAIFIPYQPQWLIFLGFFGNLILIIAVHIKLFGFPSRVYDVFYVIVGTLSIWIIVILGRLLFAHIERWLNFN